MITILTFPEVDKVYEERRIAKQPFLKNSFLFSKSSSVREWNSVFLRSVPYYIARGVTKELKIWRGKIES